MKTLMQLLATVLQRWQRRSVEERTLAQAVDAQDLEVRLRALERARP